MLSTLHGTDNIADEIHLSKLDGAVQLRPELHHVDAVVDSNRRGLRGQRDVDDAVRQGEARAVEMKVKQKGIDGEDMNSKKYAEQLSEIQEERWQKYDFRDDEVKSPQPPPTFHHCLLT